MKLLSTEFLSKYGDMPDHMTEFGAFVYYRTYSRWLPKLNRRETWKEAVERAVEYNVGITLKQFELNNYPAPIDKIVLEAETLFDNIFNLRQFLSGRTHWVGGAETGVANKFPLANFNCAFIDVKEWSDLAELFYLLLVGTGVGFKGSKANIAGLKPIRTDYELIHSEYKPVEKEARLERTAIEDLGNGYAKIYVGDSKEGWVEAFKWFLLFITDEKFSSIKHIKISYNSIRPHGEKLVTFGGTASGHIPLMEMFSGIDKVFKNQLDPTLAPIENNQVRPIHILDIGNLIGNNVVVGGVRRTAEMFMFDADDKEVLHAKKNIGEGMYHRFMSNNSISFETKPTREYLHEIFESIKINGEPGFVNMESAKKRRPNANGVNPCGEVLADSKGVCNLTTLNVRAFVIETEGLVPRLDFQGLMQAQALSVRAGMRMTCLDLELPEWDKIHKRDRLIGCSLTGWQDAIDLLGYDKDQELNLLSVLAEISHDTCVKYSNALRIPMPLLDTTIKPEGTLSQVAGGVSSGLHASHAPYYIRRIRVNAKDPLVTVAKGLNWTIHAEVGTPVGEEPRTAVIDFPVKSSAKKTRAEQTAIEQLQTYLDFQEIYTAHNSSNTISVKPDEWEAVEQFVWDKWDKIIGVTFLAYDGGSYELAPYEEITEEQYNELKSKMEKFDVEFLTAVEKHETEKDLAGMVSCETGACPIM